MLNKKRLTISTLIMVSILSISSVGQAISFKFNVNNIKTKRYIINSLLNNCIEENIKDNNTSLNKGQNNNNKNNTNQDNNNTKVNERKWQIITLPSNNLRWDEIFNSIRLPNKPTVPELPQVENPKEEVKEPTRPVENETEEVVESPEEAETPEENEKPTEEQETPKETERPEENPVEEKRPTTPSSLSQMELEVVSLVNIEREKNGLKPFTVSEKLSDVARLKSKDMADNGYFSHTSPTYGSPFDMMRQFGINYRTAGENIAKGYPSAQSVVNGWMNSPGHRANILNPSFNTIGVGAYKSGNTIYWTQMFTN